MTSLCYDFFSAPDLKPEGWLRKQLQIQADGLAGNLDRMWPDVQHSRWIGGDREGWERAPYWLDGFIPLAYLLDSPELKQRAIRYMEAIMARQQPDGWICPCLEEERGKYDTWTILLIGKVLILFYRCSGDKRALQAAIRAFQQLNCHLERYPLFDWGRYRWFEGLITLLELRKHLPDAQWITDLAEKLHIQGVDYMQNIRMHAKEFQHPAKAWSFDLHVVNLAMALKASTLWHCFSDREDPANAWKLLEFLQHHHGMACGHFTGDECLAGTSPIQGTELCGVVEAMYSCEINFACTGDTRFLDQLACLAFNALPAATSMDMWVHQYVQQTNQIGCVTESGRNWTTNNEQAHIFGLEPHFGCCTANFGQGWPKLALSNYLHKDGEEIVAACHLPMTLKTTIRGIDVRIVCLSEYPFRDTCLYRISCSSPVEFAFSLAIPGFAESASVNDLPAIPGTLHTVRKRWHGTEEVRVVFDFPVSRTPRPEGLFCLWRGPLLFALPIADHRETREYTRDGVERRFPYCDYEIAPAENWNYAFAGKDYQLEFLPSGKYPFDASMPPMVLNGKFRKIDWPLKAGFRAIAAPVPESIHPQGPPEQLKLIPYGCTTLRMTEMPVISET